MRLTEVTGEVERRGRWRIDDLFEAISRLSRMHGEDVGRWWATAWELHVWGFHEAKPRGATWQRGSRTWGTQ